ncbi:exo-alpha-sialidase [Pedobacter frigidisoli]|uniref:Exo-alpha-sialidase n=1 Tax=Pedobacter frigidisoli TaxID=2530455 RepID=A0A4R0P6C6_9SPHI|nr:sialidase family protein [Pedobacter frigidisoli]TCD11012.1 exo-alpha-sialidase [Pedobacter frigidisoli]
MIHHTFIKLLLVNILAITYCSGCSKDEKSVPEVPVPKQDGISISWDQNSRRRVSSPTLNARYSGYARIIQLADASLLAVYEADGNIVSVKSTDGGNTWSSATVIAPPANGSNMSVPDLLLLKGNKILVFYNARPYDIASSRKFGILVKQSSNGGESWENEKNLYEAGYQFENGCWEPSAIQLPNGEIQLYFANEGPYTNSDEQNISMLRSKDNAGSWTTVPEIVSFRPGKRDGMPVPLLLRDGKDILVSIEDNAVNTFKPYVLRNSLQENWALTIGAESANRSYALADRIGDGLYAGAPFIRQLKTGETILSYQGTEDRTNDLNFADMKVVIGDEQGRNFKSKSVPFLIPSNKSCLWNSLTVLSDGSVIAVTSTNAYANATEVWMIKGTVIKNKN